VVCLIDTSAKAPEGGTSTKSETKAEAPKKEAAKVETPKAETYASGTASPAAKRSYY